MTCNPVLAIAGKNSVAIAGAKTLIEVRRRRGLRHKILALPNRTDTGEDGWQPSFRRFALAESEMRLAGLEDTFGIENLFFFSLEYDRIIPVSKFASDRLFNIHFSLLPAYKGMYTSALPILHGASASGVTLHEIDHGIDTGPIIEQRSFRIDPRDTARDLYFNYMKIAEELFAAHIDKLLDGTYSTTPQSSEGSSYFSRRSIDYRNLNVDLNKSAAEIRNQIHAYSFREYQLPRVMGRNIVGCVVSQQRSSCRPGTLVATAADYLTLASIDYDIHLQIAT